jgi:hypothetical protein
MGSGPFPLVEESGCEHWERPSEESDREQEQGNGTLQIDHQQTSHLQNPFRLPLPIPAANTSKGPEPARSKCASALISKISR